MDALATTALTDNPQRLPLPQGVGHPVNGVHDTVLRVEAGDEVSDIK
jgi:hypothetical protein